MWEIVDCYISGIFAVLQIIIFAKFSLDKKLDISKINLFMVTLIFSFIYGLIFLYLDGVIKTLLVIVVNMSLCYKLYKVTFAKSVFMNFIYMILLMLPDLISLFCFINILKIKKVTFYNIYAGSCLGSFVVFIIFIGITYLLKKPLKKLFETKYS